MKLKKYKWNTVKIEDVCKTTSGGTPLRTKYEYYNGNIPWIKSGELHNKYVTKAEENISKLGVENSSAKIFPVNTVLVALYGVTSGTTAILKTEAATNQAVCGIIPQQDKLSYEFLYSVLTHKKEEIFKKRVGTYQMNVSQEIIRKTEIPLPPLEEQIKIAGLFQSVETAMEQVDGQEKNLHLLLQHLINELIQEDSKIRKGKLNKIVFADIATNISERAEPQNSIGQIFVGLEHVDSREIRIERFGKPDNLIGTKLRVYEGDIIFGKRNAYLRKAAVSTFNGICSAHAMVIRAKEKNILKSYLPFFMHSDAFMMRAKEISEGSISPTIKWKNLERQEFFIPELEEQNRITNIFEKIEEIRHQLKQQKTTLKHLKQKLLNEILG